MSEPAKIETRPARLWREYCEARERAQQSNDVRDGFAAGRAWSAFIAEFVADGSNRNAIHGQGAQSVR